MRTIERLKALQERFGSDIRRVDVPAPTRLFVFFPRERVRDVCQFLFEEWQGRYVVSVGVDDRPYSGHFLVGHHFAFDADHLLTSFLFEIPGDDPSIPSIADIIPGAGWAEREIRDLLGIEPIGHPYPRRLVLPDGWPEGLHPLRKEVPWNVDPPDWDPETTCRFEDPPPGCTVVPFGPFHPTLDEPEHFRLYVEGERIRGCEYRGFMVHRGIEKLAESVMGYNDIPMLAERICGICGCVHNVAYAQAVETAVGIQPPPRAEYMRTIMLEMERLHSHLLWVGLAFHILGFDTLFMQAFRIREPIMWMAEKISGNRKTYALCLIGGVRWDLTEELKEELRGVLDRLEREWMDVFRAVAKDRNIQRRTRGVGIADAELVRKYGLLGPVARAAGVDIDCRRDHPYAAYDRVDFDVVVEEEADVWARILVRVKEVFESVRIIRQCLEKMEPGPIQAEITSELPPGRLGLSSVEAPRGESHHFIITGENNRPRRWRVRAPTYQNLQGIPAMIQDQQLADMTITLGSIDPCFSCTDRLEVVDLRTGKMRTLRQAELEALVRSRSKDLNPKG